MTYDLTGIAQLAFEQSIPGRCVWVITDDVRDAELDVQALTGSGSLKITTTRSEPNLTLSVGKTGSETVRGESVLKVPALDRLEFSMNSKGDVELRIESTRKSLDIHLRQQSIGGMIVRLTPSQLTFLGIEGRANLPFGKVENTLGLAQSGRFALEYQPAHPEGQVSSWVNFGTLLFTS